MLLGSALANIGAGASVTTIHGVATPVDLSTTVGRGVGVGDGDAEGVGDGAGFLPYLLRIVVKFRLGFTALFAEIQVVGSLLPRSEERRVGKECRFRRWADHCKRQD